MNLNDKHLAFKWKDLPFEEMIPLYKSSFSQYFIQLPSHTEIFSLIIKFLISVDILNSGNSKISYAWPEPKLLCFWQPS